MVQLVSFPGSIPVSVPYKKLGKQRLVNSAILQLKSAQSECDIRDILLRLAVVNVV